MVHLIESVEPVLPAFYRGRSVFITGGTGFMGKILLERLLATCPEVDNLYILVREKKGTNHQIRLQQLKDCEVFDVLRKKNPSLLDKIVLVAGDVTLPDLGMTSDDFHRLRDVTVVFNIAASLKMVDRLRQSVKGNLTSVISLLNFCDTLPKLEAFIHVSTAYSNTEVSTIEERLYPPPMELPALLKLVEDNDFDEETSKKYIGLKPNTYVFTKAMAETVVERHRCEKYPTAIFRPPIVISSLKHPFPGWIDSFNGPPGVIAGISSGFLRVFPGDRSGYADMVPVDLVIDTLLAAAWETATDKLDEVRIYNCTKTENPVTWNTFEKIINNTIVDYPTKDVMMYPHFTFIKNRILFKFLQNISLQIPVRLIDFIFVLFGSKTKLSITSQKIHGMCEVLGYFTIRQWAFKNENVTNLRNKLTDQDQAIFNLDPNSINWEVLFKDLIKGTRKYVLKETDSQLLQGRERVQRFRIILIAAAAILGLLILGFISNFFRGILTVYPTAV